MKKVKVLRFGEYQELEIPEENEHVPMFEKCHRLVERGMITQKTL